MAMPTTLKRVLVQSNRACLTSLRQQARTKASKPDPLSLDEEDEIDFDAEEPVQETTTEEVPEEVEIKAERKAGPTHVYTFGSKLNGRTGTNASYMDMALLPFRGQQPTKIDFFDNFEVKKVAGCYKHNLALLADGRVFAWGSNNYGQLGCGDTSSFPKDRHAPVLVRTKDGEPLQNIVDVAVGKYHSAAVDAEGRVYTWGYGGRSVRFRPGHLLGFPASQGMYFKFNAFASPLAEFGPENGLEVECEENPFEEGKALNAKAVQIACGNIHTVVRDSAGRAWTWGYGEWGRLGQSDNEDRTKPTPIVSFLDERTGLPRIPVGSVSASDNITSLTTTDGQIYVCGSDRTRQLGFGMEEQGLRTSRFEAVNEPHRIASLSNVEGVSFGSHAAVAVNKQGVPYYWGGQETRGPQVFQGFGQRDKLKVRRVSCGSGPGFDDHRAFVTTDGLLLLNGANLFNQALANTSPKEEGLSAIAVIKRYLRSWRSTQLSSISLLTQMPAYFRDKYVVDVACGHAATVVIAEQLEGDDLAEREKILEESLAELKEAAEGNAKGEEKTTRKATNFGN